MTAVPQSYPTRNDLLSGDEHVSVFFESSSHPEISISPGKRPSRSSFFCFMRRFWNQIFTCVSLSWRLLAISVRRARVRYLLKWNSFSSSVSCLVVKLVRGAPLEGSSTESRPWSVFRSGSRYILAVKAMQYILIKHKLCLFNKHANNEWFTVKWSSRHHCTLFYICTAHKYIF